MHGLTATTTTYPHFMKPQPVQAFPSIRAAQRASFRRVTEPLPADATIAEAKRRAKNGEIIGIAPTSNHHPAGTYVVLRERPDKLKVGQVWRSINGKRARIILSIHPEEPLSSAVVRYRVDKSDRTVETNYRAFRKWADEAGSLERRNVR